MPAEQPMRPYVKSPVSVLRRNKPQALPSVIATSRPWRVNISHVRAVANDACHNEDRRMHGASRVARNGVASGVVADAEYKVVKLGYP